MSSSTKRTKKTNATTTPVVPTSLVSLFHETVNENDLYEVVTPNDTKVDTGVNVTGIIDALTSDNAYAYTCKNNMRQLFVDNGFSLNGKSENYVPNDCYLRANNGCQIQMFFDKHRGVFTGFNVRVCEVVKRINDTYVVDATQRDAMKTVLPVSCDWSRVDNDGKRNFKSNTFALDQLTDDIINQLMICHVK